MKANDLVLGNIYWFVTPGNLTTFPLSSPLVIRVRCTDKHEIIWTSTKSKAKFSLQVGWNISFQEVDTEKDIRITTDQLCWLYETKEEAEFEKFKCLSDFCKNIKSNFKRLKDIYSEYKQLNKIYG